MASEISGAIIIDGIVRKYEVFCEGLTVCTLNVKIDVNTTTINAVYVYAYTRRPI